MARRIEVAEISSGLRNKRSNNSIYQLQHNSEIGMFKFQHIRKMPIHTPRPSEEKQSTHVSYVVEHKNENYFQIILLI